MDFNDHLIPVERGQAVSQGWGTFAIPQAVTWHWTATWDLKTCRKILGGADALRKGKASAHFGVGRTWEEGVDRYVEVHNRSWHAGKGQILTWAGKPSSRATSGSRTSIGIETVHIGYARKIAPAQPDWLKWATTDCKQELAIPPWPAEQIEMMIELGTHILMRYDHLLPEDHHGHSDICPGRKLDPIGFPWVEVLEGIYGTGAVEDVWTPYRTIESRQQALIDLGYDLGSYGADGDWGRRSAAALDDFQEDNGLHDDGYWTVFTARAIHKALKATRH